MQARFFAGCALALALLAPAFSAPTQFEAGSLLVEKRGDGGPAVILIPGLGSGPWAWGDTAARLAANHVVYLVTLPGFDGRAPQKDVTLDSLQDDLLQIIESRQLRKPALIGHSLGSTLSLAFATRHSAVIAGVIAVDGLPVFPGTETAPDRKQLGAAIRAQFAGQSREQYVAGQQAYMKQVGSIDESMALKLAALSSRSDSGAVADFAAQIMTLDLRPQLAKITVPVIAVSPFYAPDFARIGVDEAGKTALYRRLLGGVEKLEVVSIAPARHFVMFDQPEKLATVVDRGLASFFEPPAR